MQILMKSYKPIHEKAYENVSESGQFAQYRICNCLRATAGLTVQ